QIRIGSAGDLAVGGEARILLVTRRGRPPPGGGFPGAAWGVCPRPCEGGDWPRTRHERTRRWPEGDGHRPAAVRGAARRVVRRALPYGARPVCGGIAGW